MDQGSQFLKPSFKDTFHKEKREWLIDVRKMINFTLSVETSLKWCF